MDTPFIGNHTILSVCIVASEQVREIMKSIVDDIQKKGENTTGYDLVAFTAVM